MASIPSSVPHFAVGDKGVKCVPGRAWDFESVLCLALCTSFCLVNSLVDSLVGSLDADLLEDPPLLTPLLLAIVCPPFSTKSLFFGRFFFSRVT